MKFYTYLHRRNDSNQVFYIGKGSGDRAYVRGRWRSKYWNSISDKHGRTVEIIAYWPTEEEAYEHEKFLIKIFREMNFPLINKNDGGDGGRHWQGRKRSPETNAKISATLKGRKRDPEAVVKERITKEAQKAAGYKQRPWTEAERAARRGDKNPAARAVVGRYDAEELKWMFEHSFEECRERFGLTDHQIKHRKCLYVKQSGISKEEVRKWAIEKIKNKLTGRKWSPQRREAYERSKNK